MSGDESKRAGSRVITGEMQDDILCVRTRDGRLMRLWKDVPLDQRAIFFDRAFAEMNGNESSGAAGTSFHKAAFSIR